MILTHLLLIVIAKLFHEPASPSHVPTMLCHWSSNTEYRVSVSVVLKVLRSWDITVEMRSPGRRFGIFDHARKSHATASD